VGGLSDPLRGALSRAKSNTLREFLVGGELRRPANNAAGDEKKQIMTVSTRAPHSLAIRCASTFEPLQFIDDRDEPVFMRECAVNNGNERREDNAQQDHDDGQHDSRQQ